MESVDDAEGGVEYLTNPEIEVGYLLKIKHIKHHDPRLVIDYLDNTIAQNPCARVDTQYYLLYPVAALHVDMLIC